MAVNGAAIYGTKTPESGVFRQENIVFTQKGNTLYAIYLLDENMETTPAELVLKNICPKKGSTVRLLGHTKPLQWMCTGTDTRIVLQSSVKMSKAPADFAWVIELTLR